MRLRFTCNLLSTILQWLTDMNVLFVQVIWVWLQLLSEHKVQMSVLWCSRHWKACWENSIFILAQSMWYDLNITCVRVVGHETVTVSSSLECMLKLCCFQQRDPQQAFACRDLLNTFTSCELILQVFVCLTETRLSTDNQSWMGFSKYYSFTQCWWLLGFFFIC